jgi:molecular chaperone DnaK
MLLFIIMEKILGIDLGTTNSVIAVIEGSKPVVIPNLEGLRTTPSVVAYTKKGKLLIGNLAKRQAVVNPDNTFYSVKRFIGRNPKELCDDLKQLSYKLVESNGKFKIKCSSLEKLFTPEEISSHILRKLAVDASKFLNQKVNKAVITVPAYFNDSQRQATKDAGLIAGLEVLRIINEPTAASLAYGLDKKNNERILVFDLGGGTFDVSILEVGDGIFEVLSTSGNTHLGGDNFDQKIADYILDEFEIVEGISLRKDNQALQRITEAAEKAKIALSTLTETKIRLPFINLTNNVAKHIDIRLTRDHFEKLCAQSIKNCRIPVEQALKDARLTNEKIEQVVLVGGSTRIPAIQNLVNSITGKKLVRIVNPDEVVAIGAAIQGGVLSGEVKDILLLDVTPLSLGIEILGGIMARIIGRNTTIPTKKMCVFSTTEDNQIEVQIRILQGEREFAKDNRILGEFQLVGIPAAPRNIQKIQVSFDIDVNGILTVNAKDDTTGVETSIITAGSSKLLDVDRDKILKDSEEFLKIDRIKKEEVDLKNEADSLIYQVNKRVEKIREKIDPINIFKVEESGIDKLITEITNDLKEENVQPIGLRKKLNVLLEIINKLEEGVCQ